MCIDTRTFYWIQERKLCRQYVFRPEPYETIDYMYTLCVYFGPNPFHDEHVRDGVPVEGERGLVEVKDSHLGFGRGCPYNTCEGVMHFNFAVYGRGAHTFE